MNVSNYLLPLSYLLTNMLVSVFSRRDTALQLNEAIIVALLATNVACNAAW